MRSYVCLLYTKRCERSRSKREQIFSGSAPVAAQTSPQPNFVFILADDMRYDDLAYMPKTTNLLGSARGMTFSRAYVAAALLPLSHFDPDRDVHPQPQGLVQR
jgi:hypothetical protein